MVTTTRRSHRTALTGGTLLTLVAGSLIAVTAGWSAAEASTATVVPAPTQRPVPASVQWARSRPRPHGNLTRPLVRRPVTIPSAATPGCAATTHDGATYCAGSLADLAHGRYPAGESRILVGVSVTTVRAATTGRPAAVTLEGYDASATCTPTPGVFCGQLIPMVALTIDWPDGPVPSAHTVIDLYGVTTGSSIRPVGFEPNVTVCHIDYC